MFKLIAAAIILAGFARLLFIPCDRIQLDAELKSAYETYRSCMNVDILCAPSLPCPRPNCMGDYLRQATALQQRFRLLAVFERRNLLSEWRPYWHYSPAP
jgi:hypothetical protein